MAYLLLYVLRIGRHRIGRNDFGHTPNSTPTRTRTPNPHQVFRSFTFKPHDEWLCFSLIAGGRSIDFAAAKQSDLANWFCGLSELLQGRPGGGVSNGKLQWRVLQMKMRAELSSAGKELI